MTGNLSVKSPNDNREIGSFSAALSAHVKERIAILGLGLLVNTLIFNYAFDYLLYPFVIWKLGVFKGGLVMTVLAGLTCHLMFIFYDWSKKDWLGIETIKSLKNYDGSGRIGKITSWVLRRSNPFILLFLSIKYDAFITTAYLRPGSHQYNGLGRRDWQIFLASLVISNAYWTLASFMGISFFEWAWKAVAG